MDELRKITEKTYNKRAMMVDKVKHEGTRFAKNDHWVQDILVQPSQQCA